MMHMMFSTPSRYFKTHSLQHYLYRYYFVVFLFVASTDGDTDLRARLKSILTHSGPKGPVTGLVP